MIRRIHHVAVAVGGIEEALAHVRDTLGLPLAHRETVAQQKVDTASFAVGESTIELVCPTDPGSPVARFIEAKGEGIHHIALEVDDIEAELARLKERGMKLIDETPRAGAGGTRIAFLHPKANRGVLIELVEVPALSK